MGSAGIRRAGAAGGSGIQADRGSDGMGHFAVEGRAKIRPTRAGDRGSKKSAGASLGSSLHFGAARALLPFKCVVKDELGCTPSRPTECWRFQGAARFAALAGLWGYLAAQRRSPIRPQDRKKIVITQQADETSREWMRAARLISDLGTRTASTRPINESRANRRVAA
jgi:hypothetical protein